MITIFRITESSVFYDLSQFKNTFLLYLLVVMRMDE